MRRYVSSDGTEKEEITMQGTPQEPINIEEGDGYSKVIKRIVLKSDTEQSEVRPSDSPELILWRGVKYSSQEMDEIAYSYWPHFSPL